MPNLLIQAPVSAESASHCRNYRPSRSATIWAKKWPGAVSPARAVADTALGGVDVPDRNPTPRVSQLALFAADPRHTRLCTYCCQLKDPLDFNPSAVRPYDPCRACDSLRHNRRRQAQREWNRWAKEHPDEAAAWVVALAADRKERSRLQALKKGEQYRKKRRARFAVDPDARERYNHYYRSRRRRFSEETREAMLAAQDGHCALCPSTKRLVLDHDHTCCSDDTRCGNCYRGMLCSNCNVALGLLRDNPDTLRAAIAYLERDRSGVA